MTAVNSSLRVNYNVKSMKQILVMIFGLTYSIGVSQSIIEWSPDYQLSLEDFQSTRTEIDERLTSYFIFSGANMEFAMQMTAGQFMFAKNFNSKVITTFNKEAAIISAPDTVTALDLVKFGQYTFDLTELYSRKFRKEMYEQKGAFSDYSFFQPIYYELQKEMNDDIARVLIETDHGGNTTRLQEEHETVLAMLEELSTFCKTCKPPKKKKK